MTTAASAVTQAKATLKQAEIRLSAEQKEQGKEKLKTVRAEIRQKRADFERISKSVRVADARVALAKEKVARCYQDLASHLQLKPECADVIPDDAEVQEWQRDHNTLLSFAYLATAHRDKEMKKMPDRMAAIRLASEITGLEYIEQNLLRKLRGELPTGWQGGLSAVR